MLNIITLELCSTVAHILLQLPLRALNGNAVQPCINYSVQV